MASHFVSQDHSWLLRWPGAWSSWHHNSFFLFLLRLYMIIMALLGWVIESKNFLLLFSVRDSRMADFDLKWVSVLHVLAAPVSGLSGEWMSVLPLQLRRKKRWNAMMGVGDCTREVYHENRPNLIKAHAFPSHLTTLTY